MAVVGTALPTYNEVTAKVITPINTCTFVVRSDGRFLTSSEENYVPFVVPAQLEIVDRLQRQYEKLCRLEGVSKSVLALITGPPGSSKSDICRILACRYPKSTLFLRYSPTTPGCNFYQIARRTASHESPTIVIIDEFDKVLDAVHSKNQATSTVSGRGGGYLIPDVSSKSDLVELLDGFSRMNNIFVIFTSNRPVDWFRGAREHDGEDYSYAIRDARMHYVLELSVPDDVDRQVIIQGAMKKYSLEEVDVDRVELERARSVAEIDNFMRRCKLC